MLRKNFFLASSLFFMLVAIGGFIPSFFLRPYFRETSLAFPYIAHGIAIFLWFAALIWQNLLIYQRKVIIHRRMGYYWFAVTAAIILTTLWVLVTVAGEYHDSLRSIENAGTLVLGNLVLVSTILIYLVIAYLKRNKRNIHIRAVYAASVTMLGPAFDRLFRNLGGDQIVAVFVAPVLFYGLLIIYDINTRKKPHVFTVIALIWALGLIPFIFFLIDKGVGKALVDLLK